MRLPAEPPRSFRPGTTRADPLERKLSPDEPCLAVDEREACGRVGEIEESLDGRRSCHEAEGEAVRSRACVPLQDHSQPGRVEEAHGAEIERHLLEAGRREVAQVSLALRRR